MIQQAWLNTLGATSAVVVLDSGLEPARPHLDPVAVKNFTHEPMENGAKHGTDMCELIASQDPECPGMAPQCDLYVAKVWTGQSVIWPHYEAGIAWALEVGADVVSMSFGMDGLSDVFKKHLAELDRRGCICLAAYSRFNAFREVPHVINVGQFGPRTDAEVIVTGEIARRRSTGRLDRITGTSVSTAILAGVAACAKAAYPLMNREKFLQVLATRQCA